MIIIKDISHWLLCIHRLYKENGGPCLSIWRIWKYDPGRFYAEQSLHSGYHEQHQELLHQSNKTKKFNKIMNHIAAIYYMIHSWFIHNTIYYHSILHPIFQFAAVQFATEPRKVFDFNDYQSGKAEDLLMKEPFMKKLTNTHRALNYTLWVDTPPPFTSTFTFRAFSSPFW